MSTKQITAPTITVNNVVIPIIPNSGSYTEGKGERTVKVLSGGGNSVVTIVGEDVSTKKSILKFKTAVTPALINIIPEWQTNVDENAATWQDPISGTTRSFNKAVLINDPEIGLGVDSEIELEFHSYPAI